MRVNPIAFPLVCIATLSVLLGQAPKAGSSASRRLADVQSRFVIDALFSVDSDQYEKRFETDSRLDVSPALGRRNEQRTGRRSGRPPRHRDGPTTEPYVQVSLAVHLIC